MFAFVPPSSRTDSLTHTPSGGHLNLSIFRCRKTDDRRAAGLGLTMTLSSAIRIAHASSKYGFVFARLGITMEPNSAFFLPRLIG